MTDSTGRASQQSNNADEQVSELRCHSSVVKSALLPTKTCKSPPKSSAKQPLIDLRQFENLTAQPLSLTMKFPISGNCVGFDLSENLFLLNDSGSMFMDPPDTRLARVYKQQYENLIEMKYNIMSVRVLFGMDIWALAAMIVNPFELVPCVGRRALNRAFFKMWEILKNFDLVPCISENPSFVSVHLCEGPGGFIQAVRNYRNINVLPTTEWEVLDSWFALTLAEDPERSKDTQREFGNVKGFWHYGVDDSGDIRNPDNIDSFVKFVLQHNNGQKIGLVTADGAVDASEDFSLQECSHLQLKFCEICTALRIQAIGGSLVIKFFDCFSEATISLIVILKCVYEHLEIVRLRTTRICNSERYIVARGFLGSTSLLEEKLIKLASDWHKALQQGKKVEMRVLKFSCDTFYESLFICNGIIATTQSAAITNAIHAATIMGEVLPSSSEKRKGLMSMLKRKLKVLDTMQQNARSLCNELSIPLHNM